MEFRVGRDVALQGVKDWIDVGLPLLAIVVTAFKETVGYNLPQALPNKENSPASVAAVHARHSEGSRNNNRRSHSKESFI